MVGLDPLPGIVNYFIGADPSKWRTHIPTYQKVGYKDVYPGIDLVYYGNQGQLEYDLIVAPGADPTQITLAFDGADQIAVDDQGDLVLTLPQSLREAADRAAPTLRLHKPVVYQRDEHGEKHLLAGTYVLKAAAAHQAVALHIQKTQHVAFQVASYDASQPLIIDPVLSWATYLGGTEYDIGYGIAVDAAGTAYVTGNTQTPASGFPGTTASLIQSTFGGGTDDAFVAKITSTPPPTCSAAQAVPAVLWSPNGQFVPIAITGVIDPDGHAVTTTVTGVTQDEPVKEAGFGNTSPDAVIQAGSASVRAERAGKGNGRVYQLSFKADDGQGDVCTGAVKVGVPHSLQKGATAIDDGQLYDSTVP